MKRATLRALRATLALGIAAAVLTVPLGAVAGTPTGLRSAGSWSPFPSSVALFHTGLALDATGRSIYTLWQDADHAGPITARLWNMDTLRPRSAAVIVSTRGMFTPATPTAVDERNHSLMVAEAAVSGAVPAISVLHSTAGVLRRAGELLTRFPADYVIRGMTTNPRKTLLYVLAQPSGCTDGVCGIGSTGLGTGAVEVDALSLTALAGGHIQSPWTAPAQVPQTCGQTIGFNYPSGMVIAGDDRHAYFGCETNSGQADQPGHNLGEVTGAADLTLPTSKSSSVALEIHAVPGKFSAGDSIAVPGPARLLLSSPNGNQSNIKVFDTRHGYYVGLIGVDDLKLDGFGVNEATGQAYYLYAGGLTAVDMSALPVPQGVVYPQYAASMGTVLRWIVVDPRTRRVFVPNSVDHIGGTVPYVDILRDSTPPDTSPAFDPSVSGYDIPEVPGVNDSSRVAVAGATGAEYRLVGGTANLLQDATHADLRGIVFRAGTRDLRLAMVSGVQLSNDEAAALAVSEAQDDATTGDSNAAAPAVPVQCLDFGGTLDTHNFDNAKTSCTLDGQKVTASAISDGSHIAVASPNAEIPYAWNQIPWDQIPWNQLPTQPKQPTQPQVPQTAAPDAVQIKSASVSVTTHRDGLGSLVNEITSEADGVSILGVVTIGKVVATATTSSHGRSGSASVKYTRSVSDVTASGKTVCGSTCPLSSVANSINAALQGRIHVDFPNPFQDATKDGRVSMVQDDPYHHVEQNLFNDVSNDDFSTPAMSINVNNDGDTASRLIVGLANVQAQSVYRIFPANTFQVPQVPNVPGTPHVPGTVSTVSHLPGVTGLAPAEQPRAPEVSTPGTLGGYLSRAVHLAFRSPGTILGVAVMWMLLAIPAYLAARRRLLNDLPLLTVEESL